jgi:hypothetical protein
MVSDFVGSEIGFVVQGSLAVRNCHRAHKRLQIPQVTSLPLFNLLFGCLGRC